ncbi:hypothetical protein [Mucilaginibacter sp.]|uniref:hypothetical protein n=1 Tax=Mucilaginibacter sp. TaxID=1882438 RepID=UPI00261B54A9|nr:hypothetical protein [Mucilaginibacter sp.]MDB4926307.1 glucose-phosphate cytidylyltransferase [Mucilaginibacter sp.]
MKVVLLCGGRGVIDSDTRLRIPKCLIKIGNRPLIWHVMKLFASFGHTEFILSLGFGGDQIRNYFLNAFEYLHDVEVSIKNREVSVLNKIPEEDWTIKLLDTGLTAHTGARVARCQRYLNYEPFFISYSDILSDVNINMLLKEHNEHDKLFTITGVNTPSRFGTFYFEGNSIVNYNPQAKLDMGSAKINGGFMVAKYDIFKILSPVNECDLETETFDKLLSQDQMHMYKHDGFWQNVDTERDVIYLQHQYDLNKRPWLGIN